MRLADCEDTKFLVETKGGLFDVNAPEMQANVGKQCFITATDMGLVSLLPHKIVAVQKIWDGSIAYRIETIGTKDFGRPIKANEITILNSEFNRSELLKNLEKEKAYRSKEEAEVIDNFIGYYK